MHGPVPGPPHPHVPLGLAPVIGYVATREPRPLDGDQPPPEPGAWVSDDEAQALDEFADVGAWEPSHRRLVRAVAVLLVASLILAGLGTVVEVVLAAR